jgi:GMP synthase-like glutamine amidotransferase
MRTLFVHHEAPLQAGLFDDVIADGGHVIERWAAFDDPRRPAPQDYDAVIVLGGAVHPDADASSPWLMAETELIREAIDAAVPTLGVCLGAQLIARAAGSWIGPALESEVGWFPVTLTDAGRADPVLAVVPDGAHAFQWHHYSYAVPDGAVELGRSRSCPQAFRLGEHVWGVQFHPEVTRQMVYEWTGMAPDQVAGSVGSLRSETDERIAGWNEIGRRLCLAFLEQAGAA